MCIRSISSAVVNSFYCVCYLESDTLFSAIAKMHQSILSLKPKLDWKMGKHLKDDQLIGSLGRSDWCNVADFVISALSRNTSRH